MSVRVLIVDDQPEMARAITSILSRAGFESVSATSAAVALEIIEHTPVGAIVIDLNLDGSEGGLGGLREIRARCKAPAVILSGWEDFNAAVDGYSLDVVDYVRKGGPGWEGKLVRAVEAACFLSESRALMNAPAKNMVACAVCPRRPSCSTSKRIAEISKVLVVDDDRDYVETVVELLNHGTHKVDGLWDATLAMERLRNGLRSGQPYDAVIVDLEMPHLSGEALIQQIRDEFHEDLAVIVCTGDEVRAKLLNDSNDTYILKPIDPDTFITTVDDTIAKRHKSLETDVLPDDVAERITETYNRIVIHVQRNNQ